MPCLSERAAQFIIKLGKAPVAEGFEAVYGTEAYSKLQWIDTLYRCCTAIGRISNAATGDPVGTGFLMSGADLCSGWGNGPFFLTNSHVISLDPVDEAPLHPLQAEIEFTRLNGRPRIRLGELVYSSQRIEMDISILQLIAPPDSGKLELCPTLPKISDTSMQRVYVVGHPKGQELAVSLYDNSLAEYSQQYVRYRSPTEEGNSGSPVLDRQLSCFAVHHRALKEKQLNEGVALEAIIRAMQQRLEARALTKRTARNKQTDDSAVLSYLKDETNLKLSTSNRFAPHTSRRHDATADRFTMSRTENWRTDFRKQKSSATTGDTPID